MAKQTVVTLIDDIDGGPADETVTFAHRGQSYEIDLSAKNADKLQAALAPWIAAGRKSGRTGSSRRSSSASGIDPKAVRAWATSKKIAVPARGRIPTAVIDQFRAAGH
ncbi:MAG: Lsr2 family protein [Frankiaceae bacterium]|nr:Lsr2 family protein [Frankiaceae bacterium]MBV9869354.1 Lsr2 family protein [Frankiaceae bacterium]